MTTRVCEQLKIQVLNLIDDILIITPNEPDVILIRLFFENQVEPERLMNEFIKWVHPWKDFIKRRDEKFFQDNEHIFGPLPTDKLKYLKKRLNDGTLDPEDKDAIWKYFEVFISLMDKYKKLT